MPGNGTLRGGRPRGRTAARRSLLLARLLGVGLALALAHATAPAAAAQAASPAATKSPDPGSAQDGASAVDLGLYARLLATHTRETRSLAGTEVDYAALVRSADLDRLVAQLEASKPSRLDRAGRLAFWINAYNILTLDLVRKNLPVASIKDLGSFFSPVWKRPLTTIEGRIVSLDAIEHAILRPMGEPRIHAAIVCASKSCPALRRAPFRPESLDADLAEAMRRFLASPEKGVAIDRAAGIVRISKIFDWFEADFAAQGGVRAVIAAHLPEPDARWLRGPGRDAELETFDYDWTLNGLAPD